MTSQNSFLPEGIFIIAEIGVNHNGRIETAKELIQSAKISGADAVKFQSFVAHELATSVTPKVPYQENNDSNPSHLSMLENLELTHHQQVELLEYSNMTGIEFISTPYSVQEAIFLNSIGVKKFKVASADIVDIPLHEKIASFGKPSLVSVGMASIDEISEVVEIYKRSDTELSLFHCTSEYPTTPNHTFLHRIEKIRKMTDGYVGFSDHTQGNIAAVMSVALGCRIIEKHITLNKGDIGPDHAASMNISEFKKYCQLIREAYISLGTAAFFQTKDETLMAQTSRKSLHLAREFKIGEEITEEDLILMRPGTGIFWRDRAKIVGKKAKNNLPKNYLISSRDFE